MWKGWAYYFCFFNKTSCLHAIYLNNCNHLLPPPLLFPFGEKELLEITSVSCEFWRSSQEYKAHASVDRSDPPGERGDTVPFPHPGRGEQAGVSSTFYRSYTWSQATDFSLQLLPRVSQTLPRMRVHFRYPCFEGTVSGTCWQDTVFP